MRQGRQQREHGSCKQDCGGGNQAPLGTHQAWKPSRKKIQQRRRALAPGTVEQMMATQCDPVQAIDKVRTVLTLAREREQLADTPVSARDVLVGQCTGLRGWWLAAALAIVAVKPVLEAAPLPFVVLLENNLLHCLPTR